MKRRKKSARIAPPEPKPVDKLKTVENDRLAVDLFRTILRSCEQAKKRREDREKSPKNCCQE